MPTKHTKKMEDSQKLETFIEYPSDNVLEDYTKSRLTGDKQGCQNWI